MKRLGLAVALSLAVLSCNYDEPLRPEAITAYISYHTTLAGYPYASAVPTFGVAWVTQFTGQAIQRFDVASGAPSGSPFPSGPTGSMPTQIAPNAGRTRMIVGNWGTDDVTSIDISNPASFLFVHVNGDPSGIIAAKNDDNIAYVGLTNGEIDKIDFGTQQVVGTITGLQTAAGYHFVWNPAGTKLYASARGINTGGAVYEIDPNNFNAGPTHTFATGHDPQAMAMSADGTKLYVAMQEYDAQTPNVGSVQVWNVTQVPFPTSPVETYNFGCQAFGLTLNPDETRLYVGCVYAGKILLLDATNHGAVLETNTVGGMPRELSVDYGTGTVVAPNQNGGVDFLDDRVNVPLSGPPDPMLLPWATTQEPLRTAYDLLSVQGLAAGSWYRDPTTGVKIYKLTSAAFPPSGSSWGHDYAEGGDEVSLPYNGNGITRAVLVRGIGTGVWYLVDFTPGATPAVGNARQLTVPLAPYSDLAFTFSSNPATPYYAYVSTGSSVQRIDIRGSITAAPLTGVWPVNNQSNAGWLHQSEGDAFFTWVSGTVVVGYEPATPLLRTHPVSDVDQPQINRNSSFGRRQVAINTTPGEAMVLWDFALDAEICTRSRSPDGQFNHMAALHDRWMGINWADGAPLPPRHYHQFFNDCSVHDLGGPASANDYYGNGNWNQHPASPEDQWALFSTQSGLEPEPPQPENGSYLAPGGMVYVTANGQRRLLGHPYNTFVKLEGESDSKLSFVKQSSDGRYVLFTSNMNSDDHSSRTDLFLAEVPVRGPAPPPPLAPPTNCQLQWLVQPKYVRVSWTNSGESGVSTEVSYYYASVWTVDGTAGPGGTSWVKTPGAGQNGIWQARVRHVKTGFPPSTYCTTNTVTVSGM